MVAFKDYLDEALVADLGDRTAAAWPGFDRSAFVSRATSGLAALEFKGRVRQIAGALRTGLPQDWQRTLRILVEASGPPSDGPPGSAGNGFHNWPLVEVVGMYGADHVPASLDALYELTRRFSGEFAIRPLFRRAPDVVWGRLAMWVEDPDPHVRRLVSEGSRPRLPWGEAIPPAPERALPLLATLVDDPVEVVRRSAANHLNDLSRTHSQVVLDAAGDWLGQRPWVSPTLRHGLRGLVKAGDLQALALLGAGVPVAVTGVSVSDEVVLGEALQVRASVTAPPDTGTEVVVDVVIGFPTVGGGHGERVFRGGRRTLGAGEVWALSKDIPLRAVTTRSNRLGRHTAAVQANGTRVWSGHFDLLAPPDGRLQPRSTV